MRKYYKMVQCTSWKYCKPLPIFRKPMKQPELDSLNWELASNYVGKWIINVRLSATCNNEQRKATFPVSHCQLICAFTESTEATFPPPPQGCPLVPSTPFISAFRIQRKPCPSSSMPPPWGTGLSLPKCWAVFTCPYSLPYWEPSFHARSCFPSNEGSFSCDRSDSETLPSFQD